MRTALTLIALLLTSGAAAQQNGPSAPAPDVQVLPTPSAPVSTLSPDGGKVCTDRIHQVRGERGLPRLERGTATPDEALLIAAVDHRIDGCSVMVMRYDIRDVRPLPIRERPPQMERIPGG